MKKCGKIICILVVLVLVLGGFLCWKCIARTPFSDKAALHIDRVYFYAQDMTERISQEQSSQLAEILSTLRLTPTFRGAGAYSLDEYPFSIDVTYGADAENRYRIRLGTFDAVVSQSPSSSARYHIQNSDELQKALEELFRDVK